jgi:ribose/xylose/arabinose/galactoside ABC-type transport system permease subunit
MAFGMTFVIVAGSIDLSVGSVVSLSGVVCISIINKFGADGWAIFTAISSGAIVGLINGLIISKIKGRIGESFIITYGMQTAVAALALIYSGASFMNGEGDGFHRVIGKGSGPIIIFIVLAIILHFILTKTTFGRKVYFMGSNSLAAKMSGINVTNITIIIFVIAGVTAALASVVLSSRVNAASPVSGKGYELEAIAAVVVGGTSMSGGKGGVINTVIGVIVIGVLGNALNILNVTAYPQMMIRGVIIVLAVALDVWNQRTRNSELAE